MKELRIDFLIIGAAKCATTSYQFYLRQHPDIYMPARMGINHETGFFLKPGAEQVKGVTNDMIRRDCGRMFEGYAGQPCIGERSTDYAKHPFRTVDFAGIQDNNPRMKILYFVASPHERLIKLYRHHLRHRPAFTAASLGVELEKEGEYYQKVCSYHFQLRRYLDTFGPASIRVVQVDSTGNGIAARVMAIQRFLGVAEIPPPEAEKRHNVNPGTSVAFGGVIPPGILNALAEDYARLNELRQTEPAMFIP